MAVTVSRIQLGEGVFLTRIEDPKFKTNSVSVRFISKLAPETSAAFSLAPAVLTTSNKKFPTRTALSEKLSALYGASLSTNSAKIADMQYSSFSCSCIRDEFALADEPVTEETVTLLLDCIFNPATEDGVFQNSYFELRKQELLDSIDAEINDKRSYALLRAGYTVFENEAGALPPYGSREQVEQLTNAGVFAAYRQLLADSVVEITAAGGGGLDKTIAILEEQFGALPRENVHTAVYRAFSPLKSEPARVTEELDVSQCKMVLAFKTTFEDLYKTKVCVALFGGTPFSKLFMNVREKLSLCYYCVARNIDGKGTMIVDCGVEKDNIRVAEEEILRQLADVAAGNFSEEELENTRLYIADAFRSNYDSLSDLSGWYFVQQTRGTQLSPDAVIRIIHAVTREDVIACAQSMALDTVYVLQNP